MVTVLRRPAIDVGTLPPAVSSVLTGSDGSFALNGFGRGTYRLCAQQPQSQLINPCEWDTSFTEVTFENAETKTGITIPVETGYVMKIRVIDPGDLLDTHIGKSRGAGLQVGYWPQRKPFTPVQPTLRGKGQWEYSIVVPYGKAVEVSANSRFFRVEDARGSSVDEQRRVSFTVSKQQNVPPGQEVTFHVRGLKN